MRMMPMIVMSLTDLGKVVVMIAWNYGFTGTGRQMEFVITLAVVERSMMFGEDSEGDQRT